MFNMTGYVELKRRLTKVEAIEEMLMPNELGMLCSLKAKYVEPLNPNPFVGTSLNVMLRNLEIRKGYRFDPRRDGGRVINLPRRGVSKKTRQPPLAFRLPTIRPCHLAPPDYMVTEAAIMDVART